MSKDSSTLVPQPIEEKDALSKPSFADSEVGPGPALTEKSESRHISVPREDDVPTAPGAPEKARKKKKFGRFIAKIFCCRRDTTINTTTTTPIINDIPTTSTNINTANIGTTRSYPNTSGGVGGGELLKSGTDSAHVSRRSSFSHSNPVTQQIVLAPEREVQQQIVASAAVTAAAHAGGDESVQHEAARKSGEAEAHFLLPPLAKDLIGKKCLVLDLDETLVHSSFKLITQADFVVPVEIENQAHNVYVLKRPGVDEFMRQVGEYFEIVIFTASLSKYADPVLDLLDRYQVVHHRLFRESCLNYKGNYVKDLSQLGRDLRSTMIIDNSPASYILHPTNAVPVTSWFSDPHDTELLDMIPFLIDLSKVDDVTQVLDGTQDIFGDEEDEEEEAQPGAAAEFSPESMADHAPPSSVVNSPLLVR